MTDPTGDQPARTRYPLSRGWARQQLILQVARGDKNQYELAAEYGVGQPAISEFIKRNRFEIEAATRDLAREFQGLWIASKWNRLAEIQQICDDIAQAELDPVSGEPGATLDPELLRTKLAALRAAAEELGQLPARLAVKVEGTVKTEIVGVDIDALR